MNMMGRMSKTIVMEKGLTDLVMKKMDSNYECSIEDSVTKETFFIKSYDGGQTYNLYRGCNLEIGDVPLQQVIKSICWTHKDLTSTKKKMYIGKWGGVVDVFVVNDLRSLSEGVRYVGSDEGLDIYESEEGIVYGVKG